MKLAIVFECWNALYLGRGVVFPACFPNRPFGSNSRANKQQHRGMHHINKHMLWDEQEVYVPMFSESLASIKISGEGPLVLKMTNNLS